MNLILDYMITCNDESHSSNYYNKMVFSMSHCMEAHSEMNRYTPSATNLWLFAFIGKDMENDRTVSLLA